MLKSILLIALLSLTACADLPARTVVDACGWVRIIQPTEGDLSVASDTLLRQILTHNESYEENCQ